MFVQVVLNP